MGETLSNLILTEAIIDFTDYEYVNALWCTALAKQSFGQVKDCKTKTFFIGGFLLAT